MVRKLERSCSGVFSVFLNYNSHFASLYRTLGKLWFGKLLYIRFPLLVNELLLSEMSPNTIQRARPVLGHSVL